MTDQRARPIILSIWVAAGFGGISIAASASPSKQQCVDDNVAAQELRRHGSFAAASEHLQQCAVPSCPSIVREDCTRRLNDLEAAQPSVVFDVKDASGVDIVAVRVYVDSKLFTDRPDGTPLKVDPGSHVFSFEVAGQPPVTESLLVREGEAARHERVVIGNATPPSTSSRSAPTPKLPVTSQSGGPAGQQVVGLSLVGAGAVGVVTGTVFGLMANTAWNDAKRRCGGEASRCTNAPDAIPYQRKAYDDANVSTAAFIAGSALIIAGAFTYFTGSERQERKTGNVAVAPSMEPQGVGVVVEGAF